MTDMLNSFLAYFEPYAWEEFMSSPDFIGDILSDFSAPAKVQLRADILSFLALDDAVLPSTFNALGASWYISDPLALRAIFLNVIDRIDGRNEDIAALTRSG
ncbi:MAG: hypothetical protein KJS97_10445 [Alphaproteobacteria bacterium]|nr:hypothetical protein [Alphaproteobacteria bacterium]